MSTHCRKGSLVAADSRTRLTTIARRSIPTVTILRSNLGLSWSSNEARHSVCVLGARSSSICLAPRTRLIFGARLYLCSTRSRAPFARPTLMVAAYLLRGARWRIWERGLSYWDSLRLVLIGFMGNNVLPARLGEIVRAYCAAATSGGNRTLTRFLASIAAERILDGMVLAAFALVSISLVSIDPRLEWTLFVVSFVFASIGLVLVLGISRHGRIRSFIAAGHRRFPGHVTAFANEKMNQFLDGFIPLDSIGRLASAITVTAFIWILEIGFCYFIGKAIWEGMTLRVALLMLVAVNFASLVPFTMGGIGTIEAVVPVFLVSAGAVPSVALAIVLLQHASQYSFTTAAGGMLYFVSGLYRFRPGRERIAAGRPPSAAIAPAGSRAVPSKIVEETRSRLGEFGPSLKLTPRGEVDLSFVIPAYNEQFRLPRTVLETIRWCTMRNIVFEVIIADDGSRDDTLALSRLFEESDIRIRALACPHMGKGATVRMGVLNARGQIIMFMDADGATPLDEIQAPCCHQNWSRRAMGSRVAQHSDEVIVQAKMLRRAGRAFALLVNLFAIEVSPTRSADSRCFNARQLRRSSRDRSSLALRLMWKSFSLRTNWIYPSPRSPSIGSHSPVPR